LAKTIESYKKLKKESLRKAAEQSVHWTLGTAASRRAAFSSVFLASIFFYSQALSTPAPAPFYANASRSAAAEEILT
jgi:hypothetical protein